MTQSHAVRIAEYLGRWHPPEYATAERIADACQVVIDTRRYDEATRMEIARNLKSGFHCRVEFDDGWMILH